ncbi:hypothetical protein GJ744_000962 [Endocarpon pusillum]|uniref:Uncharacterized protein n=1 Tax=Endocarpon pusillum TaxID=364733 RepID=A0A8H7AE35_9EURO|nr:hypothetical protein GJ744_000962 [Endocarpon pusillum]
MIYQPVNNVGPETRTINLNYQLACETTSIASGLLDMGSAIWPHPCFTIVWTCSSSRLSYSDHNRCALSLACHAAKFSPDSLLGVCPSTFVAAVANAKRSLYFFPLHARRTLIESMAKDAILSTEKKPTCPNSGLDTS